MAATFFDTYASTGVREDVKDIITIISPQETPVYSMLREGRAFQQRHEWLTIPLPTSTGNAQTEGASYSYLSGNAETRLQNYTQIFRETWRVSGTIETALKYGRASEFDMRKLHAMKSFKIDVEWALLDNTASAAGATTATARTLKGLRGAAQDSGITATANSVSTNASPMDEAVLNSGLKLMWDQGVTPDKLVCSSFVKRQISGFLGGQAGRPIVNQNGDRVASNVVDVYESDFGRLDVIPSRILNIKSNVLFFRNDLLSLAWLRPPFVEFPPKDGDYIPGVMLGECTLEYLNPFGMGLLTRVQSA